MNKTAFSLVAGLAILLGFISCSASDKQPTTGASPVTVLDPNASQLRADFNRASGSVRLLFVIDPACSVCLRGLDDVNRDLLSQVQDPRLQTFVVHTSVIGGEQKDVAPAAALLDNPNVHHYWDPAGNFGRDVSKSLGLKHDGEVVYAWDVWMLYGSDATLPEHGINAPALFMHQLPKLRGQPGRPMLDSNELAAKARALLADLPSAR